MIHLACQIPNKVYLACSGGSDSMGVLNFLLNGKKDVVILYFNHGTEHSEKVQSQLVNYCNEIGVNIITGHINKNKPAKESWEEFWRYERYAFLNQYQCRPVITCHHLDDAVETWIFSSLHGDGKLIPIKNGNCIRPFLLAKKSELSKWCEVFWDDASNFDTVHARNFIRHVMMPNVLQINPGIHKVIKKKYLSVINK